jgi:hypothetical protein
MKMTILIYLKRRLFLEDMSVSELMVMIGLIGLFGCTILKVVLRTEWDLEKSMPLWAFTLIIGIILAFIQHW